ncbi:MAG: polysaccharide biosynthesis/export family protein [Cytophagales bacterium]
MKFTKNILWVLIPLFITSCYNKSIMFKTEHEYEGDSVLAQKLKKQHNYMIQPNDYVHFTVYTNNGERIIDPNFELRKNTGVMQQGFEQTKYLVGADSTAIFPMIGKQKVAGLQLRQLDSLLTEKYSAFYNQVYVISKILNKRVFVLGVATAGATSSNAKVIPLENENMSLIEIITLAGGLDNYAKANKIRLIRGDLKNPMVNIIDLSTIEGMKQANLIMQPNDIVYIERYQRRFMQTLQESSSVISMVSGIMVAFVAILTLKNTVSK